MAGTAFPVEFQLVRPEELDADRAAIYDLLATLPDEETFLTSEELQAEFAALCEQYEANQDVTVRLETFQSEPDDHPKAEGSIDALIIELPGADDEENEEVKDCHTAFLPFNVHTNEVAGGLTSLRMAQHLAANPDFMRRLHVKRVIFADVNPIGTRGNGETLLPGHGQMTPLDYFKAIFRGDQPEWELSFDFVSDKGEYHFPNRFTTARMLGSVVMEKIVGKYKPDITQPQHNGGFWPGVYTCLSRRVGRLVDDLITFREAARPVLFPGPLDFRGQSEEFGPGVYPSLMAKAHYQRRSEKGLPAEGEDPAKYGLPRGDTLGGYIAATMGDRPVVVVDETPYFLIDSAYDPTELPDTTIADVKAEFRPLIENMMVQMNSILAHYEATVTTLDPVQDMLYRSTKFLAMLWQDTVTNLFQGPPKDEDLRTATVGDRVAFCTFNVVYLGLALGQAWRLALAAGNESAQQTEATLVEVAAWVKQNLNPQPLPRKALVTRQVGTAYLSWLALKEESLARAG